MTELVIHPGWEVTPEGERVGFRLDMLGEIPFFLELLDRRPAREQIDSRYGHGGGWQPTAARFALHFDAGGFPTIIAPGDPPLKAWAWTYLPQTGERIFYFVSSFVLILQADDKAEIARVD